MRHRARRRAAPALDTVRGLARRGRRPLLSQGGREAATGALAAGVVLAAGGAWAATAFDGGDAATPGDVPLADETLHDGGSRPSRGDVRLELPSPASTSGSAEPGPSPTTRARASSKGRRPATATPTEMRASEDDAGSTPRANPDETSEPSTPSQQPTSNSPTDGQAPQTRIVSAPEDNEPALFGFSASEPASFACSLDGAGYAPCGVTTQLPDVGAGWHTLRVRATDAAGNTDPTPATWRWHASAAGLE